MRTMSLSVLAVAAIVCFPLTAAAQMKWTDKAVASVNGGAQVGSHTLTTTKSFSLYDETGTLTATQEVGGGGFFNIGAGYKAWSNLLVGLDYSHASSRQNAAIQADVPDPLVFDHHRRVSGSSSGMSYKENAIHLTGTWMVPVTDKIDVGLVFGPSIFMIKQDVPSELTVTEPGPTIASTAAARVKKTTGGVNFGLDTTYLLTKKAGVGVLARYTWGSVKIDGASKSLTVGGFQLGAGIRYRF